MFRGLKVLLATVLALVLLMIFLIGINLMLKGMIFVGGSLLATSVLCAIVLVKKGRGRSRPSPQKILDELAANARTKA